MTMGVFDFRSIKRKLDCMDQKAEYEAKNPPAPEPSMYGWPYGVAVPFDPPVHWHYDVNGGRGYVYIAPFVAPDQDPA